MRVGNPHLMRLPQKTRTNKNMRKQLINITAHVYEGNRIAIGEQTYAFIRYYMQPKPTWRGAERMVAHEVGAKPKDVSVTRIEAMDYAVQPRNSKR
jgi:hypothetical protein